MRRSSFKYSSIPEYHPSTLSPLFCSLTPKCLIYKLEQGYVHTAGHVVLPVHKLYLYPDKLPKVSFPASCPHPVIPLSDSLGDNRTTTTTECSISPQSMISLCALSHFYQYRCNKRSHWVWWGRSLLTQKMSMIFLSYGLRACPACGSPLWISWNFPNDISIKNNLLYNRDRPT